MQRVCQQWKILISTNTTLLTTMWLHPGLPSTRIDNTVAATQMNPLLRENFSTIFERSRFQDCFTFHPDRQSPFMHMWHFDAGIPNRCVKR